MSGRNSKHKYVQFWFKDQEGNKVLGAQGFDHGDAHYLYKIAPKFTTKYGTIQCHNRKDLVSWLEMVIKESRMLADGTVEIEKALLGAPTADNPEGLYYVSTLYVASPISAPSLCASSNYERTVDYTLSVELLTCFIVAVLASLYLMKSLLFGLSISVDRTR